MADVIAAIDFSVSRTTSASVAVRMIIRSTRGNAPAVCGAACATPPSAATAGAPFSSRAGGGGGCGAASVFTSCGCDGATLADSLFLQAASVMRRSRETEMILRMSSKTRVERATKLIAQRARQRRVNVVAECDEDHTIERVRMRVDERLHFAHRDLRSVVNWIAVDAATDRWKRDRANVVVDRELQARSIARREQLRLAAITAAPHRTDRMNHPLRRQPITARHPRLAGRTSADRSAFGEQVRTSRAVNRAVDSAAAEERGVGGVDDGVEGELGDVAAMKLDHFFFPSFSTMSNSDFVTG